MKKIEYIFLLLAVCLPAVVKAQDNVITFEEGTASYTSLGVYDFWEASPFRTGKLKGNCKVVDNPYPQEGVNTSRKVLGFQRSLYASNMFGARIDLQENKRFELNNQLKYVHVLLNKPTEGRVMLIGLGKHNTKEWAHQSQEVVQFTKTSENKAVANQWCDMVFAIKGAGNIDIYSLVVVADCESPHTFTSPFVAYIDNIEVNQTAASRTDVKVAESGNQQEKPSAKYITVTNSQRNGDVILADGKRMDNLRHQCGQPLKIKSLPEKGFKCGGIRLTHGTTQRTTVVYGPELFDKDGTFTIPGDVFDSDVMIEGVMVEKIK